jgi:hypothetical protein
MAMNPIAGSSYEEKMGRGWEGEEQFYEANLIRGLRTAEIRRRRRRADAAMAEDR